jgi:hypothetical protein
MFAGPPFCAAYAYHAWRGARGKYLALTGLVFAGVEVLFLAAVVLIGYLATG